MRRLVILSAAVSLVAACGGGGGGGPVLSGAPGTPTFTGVLTTGLRVNWTAAAGADSYKRFPPRKERKNGSLDMTREVGARRAHARGASRETQ